MKRSKKIIYLSVLIFSFLLLNYAFNSFVRFNDKNVKRNNLINKQYVSLDTYSYINFRLLENAFCLIENELIYFNEFEMKENIVVLRSNLEEYRIIALDRKIIYLENTNMYFYLSEV